tara:strand:- start:36758 stop:37447 length:690 start_codon:yes stop_codon:yes gene_type:complete
VINANALSRIKEKIYNSILVNNIPNHKVDIIAVTKTFPKEAIVSAFKEEILNIGENKIQEAEFKFPKLPDLPKLKKRLIGHLQSNKVNKAVKLFDAIDTIDSKKIARRLDNSLNRINQTKEVMLQVNTSGDNAKYGFNLTDEENLLEIISYKQLVVRGLMTIGEFTSDERKTRKTFILLRQLKEKLNDQLENEKKLIDLSMGMSSDYDIAVEEGSTQIRLGTALFGSRT